MIENNINVNRKHTSNNARSSSIKQTSALQIKETFQTVNNFIWKISLVYFVSNLICEPRTVMFRATNLTGRAIMRHFPFLSWMHPNWLIANAQHISDHLTVS